VLVRSAQLGSSSICGFHARTVPMLFIGVYHALIGWKWWCWRITS
jgi:hypothetical protein